MKFSAIICALLASSVAAFSPMADVDRRVALGQITAGVVGVAAGVVGVAQPAFADGAVSKVTIQRSRAVYGNKVAALESAVQSGDFAAIAESKNAFILFNSGAYPRVKDKALKKAAIEQTNAIFTAIRAGDKAAVKSAYSSYVAANGIKSFDSVSTSDGQGYSSDFDYRVKTSSGAIYQR
eukprot:CAMPEP_0198142444 /NCGR_PEP_ID=MMETSP1443-20131203/5212_1 /TAXON_ID=186043 /ORGANISM="Entomoneis sp., Strain CCMP2396" /LENGTH=179 /DNA_ID=CAMNT_0043805451 /DNA_START=776 /DNA_END=1315 /DNA_ORIENTATION=+